MPVNKQACEVIFCAECYIETSDMASNIMGTLGSTVVTTT